MAMSLGLAAEGSAQLFQWTPEQLISNGQEPVQSFP